MTRKLELSARFAVRMRLIAILAGALVSLATPITYFLMNLGEQRIEAGHLSQELARELKATVRINPELWQYSVVKFMRIFDELETEAIYRVRIYGLNEVLLESEDFGARSRLYVTESTDIVYNNALYGRVEVDKRADSTLSSTLGLGMAFALLGVGAGFLLFLFPTAIVKRAEGSMVEILDRLELEVSERIAKEYQLSDSLREKEILLMEIHHRVKNNLQLISSLISLKMKDAGEGEARDILEDVKGKIYSMASVHEQLYASPSLGTIDMGTYLNALAAGNKVSERKDGPRLEYDVRAEGIMLSIKVAMPIGLIVSELLTNCLKYAFAGRDSGRIEISLVEAGEGLIELSVADDGIGVDPARLEEDGATLGYVLIKSLVSQIRGRLTLENGQGLRVRVEAIDTRL